MNPQNPQQIPGQPQQNQPPQPGQSIVPGQGQPQAISPFQSHVRRPGASPSSQVTPQAYAAPPQAPTATAYPTYSANSGRAPRGRKILLWVLLFLVVVGIGAGVYYFVAGQNKTVALDSAQQISFDGPATIDGYQENSNDTATAWISDDAACVINYGILSQEELPGKTTAEVIKNYVTQLKDNGAEVIEGKEIARLELKSPDDKTTYLLPTASFISSASDIWTVANYSMVKIAGDAHAVASRYCTGESQQSAQNALAAMPSLTNLVKITVAQ